MPNESALLQQIHLALGSRITGRCFRNNVGQLQDRAGRWVRFGLFVGSGDLIHFESVTITPEMVGQTVAVACSVEVKGIGGRATDDQKRWIDMLRRMGGRAGIARSVDEAVAIVAGVAL